LTVATYTTSLYSDIRHLFVTWCRSCQIHYSYWWCKNFSCQTEVRCICWQWILPDWAKSLFCVLEHIPILYVFSLLDHIVQGLEMIS